MTITAVPGQTEPATEIEERFAEDVWPLVDVMTLWARRLTYTQADAEDLLQETLLHAFRGFRTFRPGTNLKAWLFRIMHNQWANAYRWKARRPSEVLSDEITDRDLSAHGARTTHGLRSAEEEALDLLPDNEIREAMTALSEGLRTALYYVDVEGYPYAETARLMNIPIGTVMSRVSRARIQLRRALAHTSHARGPRVSNPRLVA